MDLSTARTLARDLMDTHGLHDWTLTFDNAKRRLGCCRESRREISLSRLLIELNDEATVRDTVLHEIAHALVGAAAGHGPRWQATARRIGANPQRCASGVVAPIPKWVGRCPVCDFTVGRHRLVGNAKTAACPDCCNRHRNGRYDAEFRLTWTENVARLAVAG